MGKLIVLGIMVIASTLGGGFVARYLAAPAAPGEIAAVEETIEHARLDPVSVPIVRNGKISGYVVANVAFSAVAADLKDHKDELALFVNEAAFQALYEEQSFDFSALRRAQLGELATRIQNSANGRLGGRRVRAAVIESLNFLTPQEVRDARRRM